MGFADEFLKGVMLGREQQDRRRRVTSEEEWRRQQAETQGQQRERQARFDAQADALQKLQLAASQYAPEEALPPGQAGPAQLAPRQPIQVPSVVPGGQATQVMPRYLTDILAQKRAEDDLARTAKLEDEQRKAAAERVTIGPEHPFTQFGLKPGSYTERELTVYQGLENARASREAGAGIRADAAAARAAAAEEKKTLADAAADAFVEAAKGGQVVDPPASLKPLVQERATKAGIKLLKPKEADAARDLETIMSLTREVESLYKPEYVGMVQGRWPEYLSSDPQFHTFRSKAQRLYDIQAKYNSGQAVVGSEELRLNRELPRATDSETNFTAKTAALLQEAEDKYNRLTKLRGPEMQTGKKAPASVDELKAAQDLIAKYSR